MMYSLYIDHEYKTLKKPISNLCFLSLLQGLKAQNDTFFGNLLFSFENVPLHLSQSGFLWYNPFIF